MPDLGIGEAIAAFSGADLLSALGIGSAEAAPAIAGAADIAAPAAFDTGLATIGAGAGAADTGLAAFTGTGEALAGGGATGLSGTALAGGAGSDIGALLGTGAATAGGTALDFMGAPLASGFNPAAITPGASLTPGTTEFGGLPGVGQPVGGVGGGSGSAPSVFNTGAPAVPGVGSAGQPAAASAASVAAPSGIAPAAGVDPTAAAGAATGGGTGAAGAAPSSPISSLLGGAEKSLTSNPLGIGLGVAGLGYNILQGQKQTANQKALTADAATATANSNQMVASGEALQQYLTSGTLPPQYMTQVQQAIQDAKTTAVSNAAAQGLPTDPIKNTALATELAKIDASEPAMISQVASQLFSSGTSLVNAGQSAAGLSGQLYQTLVQNDTTQAANTGKAIATLAAALNGKSSNTIGGTNISVSQG